MTVSAEAREFVRTAEGRATVELLDMNAEQRVQLRQVLVRRGWSP